MQGDRIYKDGLVRIVDYEVSPEDQRAFEQRADDKRYAVLDAAVAAGKIPRPGNEQRTSCRGGPSSHVV